MTDTTYPDKDDVARIKDKDNVLGIDASDYDEELYHFAGVYSVDLLKDVLEIVETLNWDAVNIGSIQHPDNDEYNDEALLLVSPDVSRPWHGDQASVSLAGRANTEYGDNDE